MCGTLPLLQHVRDALQVDGSLLVALHDRVMNCRAVKRRCFVKLEGVVLKLALHLERLHEFCEKRVDVPQGFGGMFPLDDVIAVEGKIVTDEYLRAVGHADGERLVVTVAEAADIGVIAVGALEGEDAEESLAVLCNAEVFLGYFVAVEREGMPEHLHETVMRDRDVRRSCGGDGKVAEVVIGNGFGAGV